jgi:hypothetical protein
MLLDLALCALPDLQRPSFRGGLRNIHAVPVSIAFQAGYTSVSNKTPPAAVIIA